MATKPATFEEYKLYKGTVTVRFYPLAHFYKVWDPEFVDHITGEISPLEGQRVGGATGITGAMNKGDGLMMWPMYEMKKFLKEYFRTHTLEEIIDGEYTFEDILREGTRAHAKKSDRGKSVGTDAHAWVEQYLLRLWAYQTKVLPKLPTGMDPAPILEMAIAGKEGKPFVAPDIPDVEEIAQVLKRSYIRIMNELKPKELDHFKQLPKLIMQDIEIQEAIFIEATMMQKATTAAKAWFERHEITVNGVEGVVWSRELMTSGAYDSDLTVKCTEKCNWCYRNGNNELPKKDYAGRYVVDYKSTNQSKDAPKGIYPEYLAQCGVYDIGLSEEFPERKYDGYLILNGSKQSIVDADGNELPNFNSHFSFEREANQDWARSCLRVKNHMYRGKLEMEASK